MTGKLRLEDLRVLCSRCGGSGSIETSQSEDARFSYQDQCPECSSYGFVPASIADWVEVGRQLGAEIVESAGVTFVDMPEGRDGLILAVESRGWDATPHTYLLFRLPVESPTPKEEEL